MCVFNGGFANGSGVVLPAVDRSREDRSRDQTDPSRDQAKQVRSMGHEDLPAEPEDDAPDPSVGGLWRGSDRRTRDDERRGRLLDAALELFGTRGYRATSVQQVCREAGVSSRSFYELHNGLESLFAELYDLLNVEVIAGIVGVRAASGPQDLPAVVRAVVTGALTPMLRDERTYRVLEVEAVGVSDEIERQRRRTYQAIAATIQRTLEDMVRTGRIARPVGSMTGILLAGGVTEILAQRLQQPAAKRLEAQEFIEQITATVVRLVG